MHSLPIPLLLLSCATLLLTRGGAAQESHYIRRAYQKYEHRIPMRDGVELYTVVYVPRDTLRLSPMLLQRTPYGAGPYGPSAYTTRLGPATGFEREPYIYVYQDVRGRFLSQGDFVNMTPHRQEKRGPADVDESTDTYDTIDWLLRHVPRHNGRVGTWGISYPGFFTAAGMIDAHPAHVAASPQAPQADWFVGDDAHHNGAFLLASVFSFFAGFGQARPAPTARGPTRFDFGTRDGYRFFLDMGPLANANARYLKNRIAFWNDIMAHGTYDAFWQERAILPHLRNIRPAVMTVGGWFDSNNLYGALNVYQTVERTSPSTPNVLVLGPWSHGQWARNSGERLSRVCFESATGTFFRDSIQVPFFDHYLKDKGDLRWPEAYVFETGRNRWRRFDSWPPGDLAPQALYLRARGALSFDPPPERDAFDDYVSDPAKPVPYIDAMATNMTGDYMIQDQRFAATRSDVLTYRGQTLAGDYTIAGPIEVKLFASTTGTDADWVVKLIDVYPDSGPVWDADCVPTRAAKRLHPLAGYQQLVRGDVVRGKFRRSLENPEPMVPGQVTEIAFVMPDVMHTFPRGHRIMIQVQSSWFPLVDRNPQQFVDIYGAAEADFQKATQRVYRSAAAASRIVVGTLKDRD